MAKEVSTLPGWLQSLSSLDLSRLADEFISRARQDPAKALGFWHEALPFVPHPLRLALGRLVDARLDLLARCALHKCVGGNAFLLHRMVERKARPLMPPIAFFTPWLAHDNYASLVLTFGSAAAKEALMQGQLVLLALRKESSTLAHRGHGSYDDHIVVLNGLGAPKRPGIFPACTEPGAQYSQRASFKPVAAVRSAPAGAAPLKDRPKTRVDARYAGVAFSKSEGADVNGDGIKDAGRLLAGTYKYFEKSGGFLNARAFQVKVTQQVERDTDGDGFFTTADDNRIDSKGAGTSMYIHRGGADTDKEPNTWSAGCQTIPKNRFNGFLLKVGRPKSFFYVLVNTVVA